MIYLASPMSSTDPEVALKRVAEVTEWTAKAWLHGHTVFSPIAHSAGFGPYMGAVHHTRPDQNYDFWQGHNNNLIRASDELWVLCLDGWHKSKGIAMEIEYWHTLHPNGPKVRYFMPNYWENADAEV